MCVENSTHTQNVCDYCKLVKLPIVILSGRIHKRCHSPLDSVRIKFIFIVVHLMSYQCSNNWDVCIMVVTTNDESKICKRTHKCYWIQTCQMDRVYIIYMVYLHIILKARRF